ncbi:MAG: spore germination protein GerW family protein [Candidatus Korobacteraceae bacterium]
METNTLVSSIGESVTTGLNARTVFAEPVSAHGRTILPVARIGYGFGGGSGARPGRDPLAQNETGGGGGGGGMAVPIGVVEITAEGVRYIPFTSSRKLALAAAAGLLLGMWIGRRRGRRRFR